MVRAESAQRGQSCLRAAGSQVYPVKKSLFVGSSRTKDRLFMRPPTGCGTPSRCTSGGSQELTAPGVSPLSPPLRPHPPGLWRSALRTARTSLPCSR